MNSHRTPSSSSIDPQHFALHDSNTDTNLLLKLRTLRKNIKKRKGGIQKESTARTRFKGLELCVYRTNGPCHLHHHEVCWVYWHPRDPFRDVTLLSLSLLVHRGHGESVDVELEEIRSREPVLAPKNPLVVLGELGFLSIPVDNREVIQGPFAGRRRTILPRFLRLYRVL